MKSADKHDLFLRFKSLIIINEIRLQITLAVNIKYKYFNEIKILINEL